MIAMRGSATASYYFYSIGLNTWITPTVFAGVETFTLGSTSALLTGFRKLFITKEAQQRCYIMDLTNGVLEPAGWMPYAVPLAYDGHRIRSVITSDGVMWLYALRAGGQELFRVPIEWPI
jgi:hypothetical protein